MAIAPMQKVMIVAHRSQVSDLVQALQEAGIVQVLDAERAMVTKDWPELEIEPRRHREMEESISRLEGAIDFLKPYTTAKSSLFAPRVEVNFETYTDVISTDAANRLLEATETVRDQLEKRKNEYETNTALIEKLQPWASLTIPVEELHSLYTSTTFVGLIPQQRFDEAVEKLAELGAAVEKVADWHDMAACLGVCLEEAASDVQRTLRSLEFEATSFEGLRGLVRENIDRLQSRQEAIQKEQGELDRQAKDLAKDRLKLQILSDHYQNLLGRIQTESTAPATEHAILLEGWVKTTNYQTLEKVVTRFDACDIAPIEPGQEEQPPVEIDNGPASRPFETITQLYGTPSHTDVDPTAFLAPFFAVFFGLCLTDAGYGFVLALLLAWAVRKVQGDKKALWMLLICSVMTIGAGIITGGWFADTIQTLLPQGEGTIGSTLNAWRVKLMLFDPMEQPLIFIGIALGLGFIQVLFGLLVGLYNHLRLGNYAAAIFEKLTWVIMLSCLLLFALAGSGLLPAAVGTVSWMTAVVMAILIFLFSERNSGLAGRIGGGVFAVFSTVFYLGDILSYVRLMALGMVTAGLGMAVNILTQLVMDVPYVGFILGLLLFVFGHALNLALSLLSAFVHSLRLQFVEFFPKFFGGGGSAFKPLRNVYEHVMVIRNNPKR